MIGAIRPRELLVVGVALLLLFGARLASWDAIGDGRFRRFALASAVAAAGALLVWLLARKYAGRGEWAALAFALAAFAVGDALHYVRRANPVAAGAPIVAVDAPTGQQAEMRRVWEVALGDGGQAIFGDGAVRLVSPPGATAYLRARIPAPPSLVTHWWLPAGLADRSRVERLAWRAMVERGGTFYGMLEAPRLLIEAVPHGVHVTYPDAQRSLQGYDANLAETTDGRAHDWALERDPTNVTLSVDGRRVWSAPQWGPLNEMRLGETRGDALHGGGMRVEAASYRLVLVP